MENKKNMPDSFSGHKYSLNVLPIFFKTQCSNSCTFLFSAIAFQHMSTGDMHCKTERFLDAEHSYSSALLFLIGDKCTLIGRLHHKRAIARMKLENFNGALDDAIFNIELNSKDVLAYLVASVCYMRIREINCSYQSSSNAKSFISQTKLAIENMEDSYNGRDVKKVC